MFREEDCVPVYYDLSFSDVRSRSKILYESYDKNAIIDYKSLWRPKGFDFFVAGTVVLSSIAVAVFVGLMVSVFLFLSNPEASEKISLMAAGFSLLGGFPVALYFSTIVRIVNSSNGLLLFRAKGVPVGSFTQENYDMVKKYAPEELGSWLEAIVDYGKDNNVEAQYYANNIVKLSCKRKVKEDEIISKMVTNKWAGKRESSEVILDLE